MKNYILGTCALAGTIALFLACDRGTSHKPGAPATPDVAPLGSGGGLTPVAVRDTTPAGRPADAAPAKEPRYALTLDGASGFAFNTITLSDDAKKKIDELLAGKTDLAGLHFEIEGHTDNVGTKAANEKVGLARAEAVKRYLVERYEILPELVNVISFGMDKPIADNVNEEGRAMNRRIVLKVLD